MKQSIKTIPAIRDAILRTIKQSLKEKGIENPNLGKNSSEYIRANAIAEAMQFSIYEAENAQFEFFASTCSEENLIKKGKQLGIERMPAEYASGSLVVSCSSSGLITIPIGEKLVNNSNGIIYSITSETALYSNNSIINVKCDSPGSIGNLIWGEKLQWQNPAGLPAQLNSFATVSQLGITNGTEQETIENYRQKIIDAEANKYIKANNDSLIAIAENSSSAIQKAYIYPALNGAGEMTVVLQGFYSPKTNYCRSINYDVRNKVKANILNEIPGGVIEINCLTVNDESSNLALYMDIPKTTVMGGTGGGWTDSQPFPEVNYSYDDVVRIDAIEGNNSISIIRDSLINDPQEGQKVLIWSSDDLKFEEFQIDYWENGGQGVILYFTRALPINLEVGNWISPSCLNKDEYAKSIVESFAKLGCSEMTTDSFRLPRAKRFPATESEWNPNLNQKLLKGILSDFSEVNDAIILYGQPKTAPIPINTTTNPSVLKLNNFAIYSTNK